MVYSIGNVSGCNINSDVSIVMLVAGETVILLIALIVEIILTFGFTTTIFGVTDKK